MRKAEIQRVTNETDIFVRINLDGRGEAQVETGIGFLDHMLAHICMHGLIDLELRAKGDLQVDLHHTTEDCAITLGQALDQALGKRGGIVRIGSAYVPMDESLAFVAIDLSGRPYTVLDMQWDTPYIGNLPTSLIPHFFESLANNLRCNLHARVLYGRDDHHRAEALFKAFGRAFESAVKIDSRRGERIPSTKGSL